MWGGRAHLRGRARLRGGGHVHLWGGQSSLSFGSFVPHFQIKLGIHASNFNSTFVVMSELELSFLMGVLAPYFNTMDLVKILENSPKISHSDRSGHIEGDVMQNHQQKKK
jgi:hypothetical protein